MVAASGLTPVDFFVKARFEPGPAVVLAASAVWYARAVRRMARTGRPWPVWRSRSFAAAWLMVAVAVFSGLTDFASGNFTAYGTQFILIGLAAPALLALAAPITLAFQSSARPDAGRILDLRPARLLANPLVTWVLFSVSMFALYFTGLFAATLGGSAVSQVVDLGLVAVGFLFYWPAADVDPIPRRMGYWPRILYLLAVFVVYTILGMSLESQTTRMVPGISVASMQLGGAVIWVAGTGIALVGALAVFVQWLRTDERRAQSHDLANEAAAARQLALWRESRDAAARASSS